jgi:magnesium transporter
MYSLIDIIVDNYFIIIDKLNEDIEEYEKNFQSGSVVSAMAEILHNTRLEILTLKKHTGPLKELVHGMTKSETPLIKDSTRVYLKDLRDHSLQLEDSLEILWESMTSSHDRYTSMLRAKMNEIMKTLTIIATIFMPLSFIAGIYGMNFKYMPELQWAWGYPLIMGLMLFIAIGMLLYFKRKNWL